jgi:hypothetical protein
MYPGVSRQVSQVSACHREAKGDKIRCSAGEPAMTGRRDFAEYRAEEAIGQRIHQRGKKQNGSAHPMLNEASMALMGEDKGPFADADEKSYQYAGERKLDGNI